MVRAPGVRICAYARDDKEGFCLIQSLCVAVVPGGPGPLLCGSTALPATNERFFVITLTAGSGTSQSTVTDNLCSDKQLEDGSVEKAIQAPPTDHSRNSNDFFQWA